MTRLVLALCLASCGARTALEDPFGVPPAGDDAGPPGCRALVLGEILQPFGDARSEGPIVVARDGGFDLVAGVIEGALEYHVVRLEVRGDVVVPGRTAVLGPEARSVGAAAARGTRLGLCYGGVDLEGPTRFTRTDTLDYASIERRTVGTDGGDHCVLLVPLADHWLVGWQARGASPADWAVSEMDDDGRLLGSSAGFTTPPLAGAVTEGGAAWVQVDVADRSRLVVMEVEAGPTWSGSTVATGTVPVERAALARASGGAISVAWLDAAEGLGSLRLDADGTTHDRASELRLGSIVEGPVLSAMSARELVLVGACDATIDGPGRLALRERRGASFAVAFSVERPVCPVRPAIASLGDRALVAWQEDARVHAALLSCTP